MKEVDRRAAKEVVGLNHDYMGGRTVLIFT